MSAAALSHLHLTPRDLDIVLMVYRYDGLVSSQIRRRFWPSFGARSPFYARLSRLINAGYLRAVPLPALQGTGSGPRFITLGQRAHALLREVAGLGVRELKRLRHSYIPMFWAHDQDCRGVRLELEQACAASNLVELTEWVNESTLKRAPIKVKLDGSMVELVADGAFTLTLRSGASKRYCFELDRGSLQSPTRFKAKIRAYLAWLDQQPTPVLYVVPDEARRQQLYRWISDQARASGQHPTLFAIALKEHCVQPTILHAPIWQVVDGPTMALVPEPHLTDRASAPSCTAEWLQAIYGERGSQP